MTLAICHHYRLLLGKTEVGLLKPDLVIYLRIDPALAAQRAGYGDEALERADFQQAVRTKMEMLINSRFWKVSDDF